MTSFFLGAIFHSVQTATESEERTEVSASLQPRKSIGLGV